MYDDCKSSAHRRGMVFDLTREFFSTQADRQNHKCAYSGLPLNLKARSDWQASPERKDRTRGYTTDNVVLVCLEFNNFKQWSADVVCRLLRNRNDSNVHVLDEVVRSVSKEITSSPPTQRSSRKEGGDPYGGGTETAACSDDVKKRRAASRKLYVKTPRGKCVRLLCDARKHSVWRREKGRSEAGTYDLSLEDIASLYTRQKGLCAYSGRPIVFEGEEAVSLERVDTARGYTRSNCVLICVFFQGADHTAHGEASGKMLVRTGNGGWSAQKVQLVRQHLEHH
jgi:hypothetical protein